MSDEKTYELWVDVLGQPFGPGDRIAFARPYGEGSALLDVGEVVRINRLNPDGEPYVDRNGDPKPTITVRPENLGRSRWKPVGKDGKNKAMNIRNPNNVLRVEPIGGMEGAAERVLEFFQTLEKADAS